MDGPTGSAFEVEKVSPPAVTSGEKLGLSLAPFSDFPDMYHNLANPVSHRDHPLFFQDSTLWVGLTSVE